MRKREIASQLESLQLLLLVSNYLINQLSNHRLVFLLTSIYFRWYKPIKPWWKHRPYISQILHSFYLLL